MPISYTNRKAQTFFLRQGVTKTGKPRYFFSKTMAEDALEQIPAGYHIEESVNGVVSLAKDRKQPILPEEISVVEEALRRHPKGNDYRVGAKGKRIIVYERSGPDAEEVVDDFAELMPMNSRQDLLAAMNSILDKNAHFSPMLHFDLVDVVDRSFCAERITYVISLPEWISIGDYGSLRDLVEQIIPLLDTDEYFELL